MEPLHIAICEDSVEEQRTLISILKRSEIPTEITIYKCGEDFMEQYQQGKYDLVFMDIYMNGMTGIETISQLRKFDSAVLVAFITTSAEHTLESYRLEAIKYIEKPAKNKPVWDLLNLAHSQKKNKPMVVFKKQGKDISMPFGQILYIEQKSHILYLHLTGGEVLQITERLDVIEPQFIKYNFLRCHKSYLVNLSYVEEIDWNLMIFSMKEGRNVHIRRASMSKARKAYEEYLFASVRGLYDK